MIVKFIAATDEYWDLVDTVKAWEAVGTYGALSAELHESAAKVLNFRQALSSTIEGLGGDSTPLLGFLNAVADASAGRGSVDGARAPWSNLKAQLQRAAVQPKPGEAQEDPSGKTELTRAPKMAYQSLKIAERHMHSPPETDREAHGWIKEDPDRGFADYKVPAYPAWSRYVRTAREHYGEQKNKPRVGRIGPSAVPIRDK